LVFNRDGRQRVLRSHRDAISFSNGAASSCTSIRLPPKHSRPRGHGGIDRRHAKIHLGGILWPTAERKTSNEKRETE